MANISCLYDPVFRSILGTELTKLYRQIEQDVTIMQNIASRNMKLALVFKSIDSSSNMPQYGGFYHYKNKSREFFDINPFDMPVFQDPPNRVIRQEDGRTITPSTRPNNHYYAFYVAVIQDKIITTMSTIPSNVVTIGDGIPPDQPVDFDAFEPEYIGQGDEHSLSGGLSDFGYPDIGQQIGDENSLFDDGLGFDDLDDLDDF